MDEQTYQQTKRRIEVTEDIITYNILVVDDEPSFSAIVSEILRSFGYKVQQASSVEDALNKLENLRPDLILTDIMMPGIDGLTFVRKLRNEPIWSSIPTIVITAKAHPSEIETTMSAGADACLIKPFSTTDLRLTVRSFLP